MNVAFLAKLAILVTQSKCASASSMAPPDIMCFLREQKAGIDTLHLSLATTGNCLGDVMGQVRKSCVDIIGCSTDPKVLEIAQKQLKSIDEIIAISESKFWAATKTILNIVYDLEATHQQIANHLQPTIVIRDEKSAMLSKAVICRLAIVYAMDSYSKMIQGGCSSTLVDGFEKSLEWVSNKIKDLEPHISLMYNSMPCSYGCKTMTELIGDENACMARIQDLCKNLRSDSECVRFRAIEGLGEQLMRIEDAHQVLSKTFRQLKKRLADPRLAMVNDESKDYNPEYYDAYDRMDPKYGSTTRKTGVFGLRY